MDARMVFTPGPWDYANAETLGSDSDDVERDVNALGETRLSLLRRLGIVIFFFLAGLTLALSMIMSSDVATIDSGDKVGLAEVQHTPRYTIIHDGTCVEHGLLPIITQAYCEAAAAELGLVDITAILTSFVHITGGCYYFKDVRQGVDGLWLATNPDNSGIGYQLAGHGQTRSPICSRKETTTMPPTTTTIEKTTSTEPEAVSRVVAGHENVWKVGDICRVRDSHDERWEYGFVVQIDPLLVKPHGWRKGFTWVIVERIDTDIVGAEDAEEIAPGTVDHAKVERGNLVESTPSSPGFDAPERDDRVDEEELEIEEVENVLEPIPTIPSIKGVCYAPVPAKHPKRIDNDDFMSVTSAPLWSRTGRGDLGLIRMLGSNTVRMYGNDPRNNHKQFLDEAHSLELGVIVGISDYPYIQMPGNCASTHFNCFSQVKASYANNLRHGFLVKRRRTSRKTDVMYHPALRAIIVMNEPDLKMFPLSRPANFAKALVSAVDAILTAEREAGIDEHYSGYLPNLTATFSFAVCPACHRVKGVQPAIGQMFEFRNAMRDPASVGYEAKNDLWKAYAFRIVNSFNTANPATDIWPLFLGTYQANFQGTPVWIGEYHAPSHVDISEDLKAIAAIVDDGATLLIGFSFFEFQVRYDKGGSEMMFGMFGLGDEVIGDMKIGKTSFPVNCLVPMTPPVERRATAEERSCGIMEPGVVYEVDSWWKQIVPGWTKPDECCTHCKEAERCKSWIWEEDGDLTTCLLLGSYPEDDAGSRTRKKNAISGFPPPRDMIWKQKEMTLHGKRAVQQLLPEALVGVFEGPGIEYDRLCQAATMHFYMYA